MATTSDSRWNPLSREHIQRGIPWVVGIGLLSLAYLPYRSMLTLFGIHVWMRWITLLEGSIATVLLMIYQAFVLKKPMSKAWYAAVLLGFLLFACFQAWEEQYTSRLGREADLHKSEVKSAELNGRLVQLESSPEGRMAVKRLETTSILNFGEICDGCCSERTFTLHGAAAGDLIRQGWPPNFPNGVTPFMVVAENDTISARICNVGAAKTITYNSVPVRAMIER